MLRGKNAADNPNSAGNKKYDVRIAE